VCTDRHGVISTSYGNVVHAVCNLLGGCRHGKGKIPDALRQPTDIYTHVIGKGLVCRAPIGMALLARSKVM